MLAQRYRMADAGSPMASPGADGLLDPTQLAQRGWDLWADFGTGTLYDRARGRALTASGAVAWTATPYGGALDFAASAANCQVDFPVFTLPTRYTIAAFIVIGSVGSLENIFTWMQNGDAGTYDHQLRLTVGGKLEWYAFAAATHSSASTFTAGSIVHAVVTFDGAAHRLYINGRLETTTAQSNGGYTGYSQPIVRLGHKTGHGSFATGTHKTLAFGQAPVAYDAGQVHELWQRPYGQVTPRRRTRAAARVIHNLSSAPLETGAPVLPSPALVQVHNLASSALDTGAPTLPTATVAQVHVLSGAPLETGAPTLPSPELVQVHALSSAALEAGAPVLPSPVLTVIGEVDAADPPPSRIILLPARARTVRLASRDRTVTLPARSRSYLLPSERN